MNNLFTAESRRLVLRPFCERDLPALRRILTDEKTNVFLPWFPPCSERELRALADNGLTRRLMGKRVDVWREKLVQKFGSADYKALSATMRPTFNRVIAQDLRGVLPRIMASTLLIWGTEDRDTPLWMGEVMAKEIPDAALVRLEGCGHFAYLEKYADFRAIAWKFLIG